MRPARPDDFRLPDLRFVPTASLVPHERHDPARQGPLVRGIQEQGVLRNPPIAALLAGDGDNARYMVLDGANRASAAREAGLPHIVAQIVQYESPHVELGTWHHALTSTERADFEQACRAIAGLECQSDSNLHARAMLARREILAYAVHAGGATTTCRGGATLEEHNALLNAIVDTYRNRATFYRTTTESFEVAHERHPDVTTLLVFPHFQPAEVIELASTGARLPAGITRHLIRWRALRVNIPLERMANESENLESKNRWLQEWLKERWAQRHVRFYEESTVLFDE